MNSSIDLPSLSLFTDAIAWRRDFHAFPELGYQEERTALRVAELLRSFGMEVSCGIGGTGVVATLENGAGPSIGLRADMDALPMQEKGEIAHRSLHPGCMHACGHDGHTSILLATARHLSVTRAFLGKVNFIFQPAEETGAGARRMIADGLFERFPMECVYGLHNWPGIPEGQIQVNPGAMMASQDMFDITLHGKGCHAAMPDNGIDPVVVASQLVTALQSLISRHLSPLDSAVISVTAVEAGSAYNVIPDVAVLRGTVRCLHSGVRQRVHELMVDMVEHLPQAFGVRGSMEYRSGYPVTQNDPGAAARVAQVASQVLGEGNVRWSAPPSMCTEDFAYMLEACPGAYFWLGADQGSNSVPLHNPHYDFNDSLIPIGVRLFTGLVASHTDSYSKGS